MAAPSDGNEYSGPRPLLTGRAEGAQRTENESLPCVVPSCPSLPPGLGRTTEQLAPGQGPPLLWKVLLPPMSCGQSFCTLASVPGWKWACGSETNVPAAGLPELGQCARCVSMHVPRRQHRRPPGDDGSLLGEPPGHRPHRLGFQSCVGWTSLWLGTWTPRVACVVPLAHFPFGSGHVSSVARTHLWAAVPLPQVVF